MVWNIDMDIEQNLMKGLFIRMWAGFKKINKGCISPPELATMGSWYTPRPEGKRRDDD